MKKKINSLRFGNIGLDRTKWLVKGVTKGIGDYGNGFLLFQLLVVKFFLMIVIILIL